MSTPEIAETKTLPILPSYEPTNEALKYCGYNIVASIEDTASGATVRTGALATGYVELLERVALCLFDVNAEISQYELAILESIGKSIEDESIWIVNELTNTPMAAHVGFADGSFHVTVGVYALLDPILGNRSGGLTSIGATVLPLAE